MSLQLCGLKPENSHISHRYILFPFVIQTKCEGIIIENSFCLHKMLPCYVTRPNGRIVEKDIHVQHVYIYMCRTYTIFEVRLQVSLYPGGLPSIVYLLILHL